MIRRLTVGVVLVWVVAAQLLFASAPPAAADSSDDSSDAIQRFGSCLAAGSTGDLLVVLDTSASLQDTDPTAQRVKAAIYMVDQLAEYVSAGNGIKLNVAVAGFADIFKPGLTWTPLSSSTVGAVDDALATYRDQNTGFETDYWNAATGARKYLDAQAKDAHDCQAWVWFSDGMYDLDKRDSSSEVSDYGKTKPYGPNVELTNDDAVQQVQDAGEKDLCRDGGVADSLRFQGVTTLAVGLGSADGFDLMRGMATGARGCGKQPTDHLGDFVLARNIDDLLFAFDEFADPQTPPISQQTPLCEGSICPDGAHVFFLDDTISSVRVLAGATIDDYHAVLVDPKGRQYDIRPGKPIPNPSSVDLSGKWESERTFELSMAKSGTNWAGRWQLVFLADGDSGDGLANTNMRLYGDVHPSWTEASDTVTAGTTVPVTTTLKDGHGTPVEKLLGAATVRAELQPAAGDPVTLPDLDKTEIGTTQQLDLSAVSPGPAKLVLTLEVTTKGDPGTTLQPDVVEYPLTVLSPPNYPTLPDAVDFGSGQDTQPVAVDVAFDGPGCVWLEGSTAQTLPEGVTTADVTSSATQNSPVEGAAIPATLAVDQVGSGLVSGELKFGTKAEGCTGDVVEVSVPYTYELTRPRNETRFWLVFAGVIAAGVLIPVALLYLMKWRTAQVPGMSLTVADLRGRISTEENFLNPVSLRRQDTRVVALEGNSRRRIVLTSRVSIVTKVGLGLTEPGDATAVPGPVVTATGSHKLPLAVQDRWIVALDANDPQHGDVEVVLILSAEATKLPEVLADAKNRAPDLIARLRANLDDRAASGSDDGPGSGPAGPGGSGGGSGAGDGGWGSPPPSSPRAPSAGTTSTDQSGTAQPHTRQPGGRGYDQW